jgi:hypothetical protein
MRTRMAKTLTLTHVFFYSHTGSLAERIYPGCAVRVALSGSSDHTANGTVRFGTLLRETDSHSVRVRLDAFAVADAPQARVNWGNGDTNYCEYITRHSW